MKLLLRAVSLSFLLYLVPLVAQEEEYAVIRGKITDEITQEPIYDALITVKGTEDATNTDSLGNYELRTKAKAPFILNISYEGYKGKDIDVYEIEPELNVSLRVGENTLSTVVFVGYDTKQKSDLVGAVSKIDPEETKSIPVASFDAQLQGKAAGV
ncbi:MAG TPA: carboxypeptidase-like regulatory domain-containing protein, partial [Cytophagales bacterium]|nr:carboxypeptidase-like regulatory domain-containing protein [Cytophagales bacterium]